MVSSKYNFLNLKLPDLLINIWDYADHLNSSVECVLCKQYQKRCIEAAKQKRKPEYINFEYVIKNLRMQNKKFYNFGETKM